MKMHEHSPIGSDPRCKHCGMSEEEGMHSIVVGGGEVTTVPEAELAGYLLMSSSKEVTPPADDDRRYMKMEPKLFMEMKLDRAKIGLKLLDEGDDAETATCLTYPGIPRTQVVYLALGNTQYRRAQDRFCENLVEYLAEHGVKAEWLD